jgi:hypothetical protein
MRLFEKQSHIYAPQGKTSCIYTCMSREKMCIPCKTLPGKGLSQETQMQGKKKVVKQQTNKKTQDNREKIKEKNTPNPKKGDCPQYGHQLRYEENLSMERGKPQ